MSTKSQKTVITTILGRPNAGKSTLMNALIKYHLSIITPKVQTTRNILKGIFTKDDTQFIFLDTPGIFTPQNKLEQLIVKYAWKSFKGVDAIILLIDSSKPIDEDLREICRKLHKNFEVIIAFNKTDIALPSSELMDEIKGFFPSSKIFNISALNKNGVDDLLDCLKEKATGEKWIYHEDEISTLPLSFLMAEITREQIFLQLKQELPYNITVHNEKYEEADDGLVYVKQVIIVNRDSHKKIVIGKSGEQIKKIRERSQENIEKYLDVKVNLSLFVSVKKWVEGRRCLSYNCLN